MNLYSREIAMVRTALGAADCAPDSLEVDLDRGVRGVLVLTWHRPGVSERREPIWEDKPPWAQAAPPSIQLRVVPAQPAKWAKLELCMLGVLEWVGTLDHGGPWSVYADARAGRVDAVRLVERALATVGGTVTRPPAGASCRKCRGLGPKRHHRNCPRRAMGTGRQRAAWTSIIIRAIRDYQTRHVIPPWFVSAAREAKAALDR